MANFKDKTNEIRIMNNGQKATIVKYLNYKDIDVLMEDGRLLKHQHYEAYKKGILGCSPKKIDRLGEEHVMKNGQRAKIVGYRNTMDIDIAFEDGTVVQHKMYAAFLAGRIKNPNFYASQRVGELRRMKNGRKAKVVKYRSSNDIDVEFEDGTLVEHKHYRNFLIGEIKYPIDYEDRIGLQKRMQNGQIATIIAYRTSKDIDVLFEDGTLVKQRTYNNFLKGRIRNTNFKYNDLWVKQRIPCTEYFFCERDKKILVLTYDEMDRLERNA